MAVGRKDIRAEDIKNKERAAKKRGCIFCQTKTDPSYTDTASLRRFISDRSKMIPKLRSGLCSKHQRKVTKEIKYARHLSLLPFVTRI